MTKPGRKPIDIALLSLWEFEWWKAFHQLRDGEQIPGSRRQTPTLGAEEAKKRIEVLKRLPAEKVVGAKLPEGPHRLVWEDWAELQRALEIQTIMAMVPEEVYARAERREIWNALWRARTLTALEDACQRWERLIQEEIRKQLENAPDDRHRVKINARLVPEFAAHIRAEAKKFLAMTRNRALPRSDYADNSRLDYLARGMAGIMAGVSPMTAIERLRNMKHGAGGPCWGQEQQHCRCWRCRQAEFGRIERLSREQEGL
jgi:hypothetical protein